MFSGNCSNVKEQNQWNCSRQVKAAVLASQNCVNRFLILDFEPYLVFLVLLMKSPLAFPVAPHHVPSLTCITCASSYCSLLCTPAWVFQQFLAVFRFFVIWSEHKYLCLNSEESFPHWNWLPVSQMGQFWAFGVFPGWLCHRRFPDTTTLLLADPSNFIDIFEY